MSKINIIQQKIKELSGGEFQNLLDAYLCKKYNIPICPLGTEDGTNKPTKGIPDSYFTMPDGKYIFIMYGSVKENSYKKLKEDVESCLDLKKTKLNKNKIKKIICAYSSSNITPSQKEELKKITGKIPLEIIDIGSLSYDLGTNYPYICSDILGISMDSNQIFSIDNFIKVYNKKSLSSPLDTKFLFREKEIKELKDSILSSPISMVIGASGIGKTKLVLETCKMLENKFKVFCVKANGTSIQEDLNTYFNNSGNYILFLDDINEINELNYILSFMHSRNENIKIKIVATVRDYAKENVIKTISKSEKYTTIKLEKFSDEQIKEFLEKNYNIVNYKYVKQILKISKGNIRLATMAAQKAIKEGLKAIRNVRELFKSYYCDVLNNINAQNDTYYTLFIIGFFGIINYKSNKVIKKLFDYFNIDEDKFSKISDNLHLLEIVDKYENEILKISDQVFRDFILYFVLIEKKFIPFEKLLMLTFPSYHSQIIEAINIIFEKFYDEKNKDYIQSEINKAWSASDKENEKYFVECFTVFNYDKSLAYIQNKINNIKQEAYDIKDYNITKNSNNETINNFEAKILSYFKYSECYLDAVELLIELFNKNHCYIHDVYIALTKSFCYDDVSFNNAYQKEYSIIEKIWQLSEKGRKINETFLLIELCKSFLKIETHITKSDSYRSITIENICIKPTKDSYNLRKYIWEILSNVYKSTIYKPSIEKFLFNYHIEGTHNKDIAKFIQFDIECLSKFFIAKKKTISFKFAVILYNITNIYTYLKTKPNKALLRYKENDEFKLLINLLKKENNYKNLEEAQQNKKKKIFKQIKHYNKQKWTNFFKAYKKYENCSFCSSNLLYEEIYNILEHFKNNPEQYSFLINLYFEKQIKTIYAPNIIVENLFKLLGIGKTKELIKKCRKDEKDLWLKTFYEKYPAKDINKSTCKELINHTNKALKNSNPKIISAFNIEKYKKIDPGIVKTLGEKICFKANEDRYIVDKFLKTYFSKEDAIKLVEIFEDNIEILEELYLRFIETSGDHSGLLFVEILNKDPEFWDIFTKTVAKDCHNEISLQVIFEHIWKNKEFTGFIDIAINNIILKNKYYIIEYVSERIFPKPTGETMIMEHQEKYISDFIAKNANNEDKIRLIFKIIHQRYENLRNEYVRELLKLNNDINIFKSIGLNEHHCMFWTGSLVPIIEQDIKHLEELKSTLTGFAFIQHRAYLDEIIRNKKAQKQCEKIQDYLNELYE